MIKFVLIIISIPFIGLAGILAFVRFLLQLTFIMAWNLSTDWYKDLLLLVDVKLKPLTK